ncbi:MAG: nucleotide pyrophosphohydrolase [Thermoplasmata archaeon]
MPDSTTTIDLLKERIREFIDRREWREYHNPKDLAMSLSIEAAELLEVFQWMDDKEIVEKLPELRGDIEEELADIAIYVLSFCIALDIDFSQIVADKIERNKEKYPVHIYKGKAHL